jgi:hypothetical protein
MILATVSDIYPADEAKRKPLALALLSALNIAFKMAGHKGCQITDVDIFDGGNGKVITLAAKPDTKPATLDDVRRFFKKGQ